MKKFEIRDDVFAPGQVLGYLHYDESTKEYNIIIADGIDPSLLHPIMESFALKGQKEVGPKWSRRWVEERVVPPNRQNIGSILRANRLTEYDDFHFLQKFSGRCGQDDCYLVPL